jgi:hypothetical protein
MATYESKTACEVTLRLADGIRLAVVAFLLVALFKIWTKRGHHLQNCKH